MKRDTIRFLVVVFPTHVGMDRHCLHYGYSVNGIPHPRGDGPPIILTGENEAGYSPPTWGWTAVLIRNERLYLVFPTHVGMDRVGLH